MTDPELTRAGHLPPGTAPGAVPGDEPSPVGGPASSTVPGSPYLSDAPARSPYSTGAFPTASTAPYDLGISRPSGPTVRPPAPNGATPFAPPPAGPPNGMSAYPPAVPSGGVPNGVPAYPPVGATNGAYPPVAAPPADDAGGRSPADPSDWLGASAPTRRALARARTVDQGRRRSRSGDQRGGRTDHDHPASVPRTRAESLRERRRERRRSQSGLRAVLNGGFEVVVVLSMALALSLLIKTFLVQSFVIPSGSMENSILIGDRVLVSKLTPTPFSLHRGDVVVFKDSEGWLGPQPASQNGPLRQALTDALTFVGLLPADSGQHLIKRVIGLPGDVVVCCDASGKLTVNGTSITEPYVKPGNVPSTQKFRVTVKAGHLWVMGDNRGDSADSRAHLTQPGGGQVPISDVVGKAFLIVWPLDRLGGVPEPSGVFAKVPAPSS